MGGCVSTTTSSNRNEETKASSSSSCFCIGLHSGRLSRRTFTDHALNMQRLSSNPNRIVTNGKGQSSCVFTQQGCKGINQDAMIVWEDFMKEGVTFCGVFDGHGPHGHLVARKVRDSLPVKLLSFLDQMKQGGNEHGHGRSNSDCAEIEKESLSDFKLNELRKEAFLKSYKAMDKELKSHPNVDCFCSGSTAVTVMKQGMNLFVGNIGDSRAIMGSKGEDDSVIAIQLTVDLKPDLPKEAERIKQCKGRVFALQDEPEVSRVWLPFADAPGLAMARAFGDFCLKKYGVISVPEFAHRTLTERDQFIILASDGVWDVLTNEEVVEIVSSAPARSSAARLLVESAAREWKLKYPTSKMDDCAVVCLFLDGKVDSEPSEYEDQGGFSSATIQSTHSCGAVADSDNGLNQEPCLQRNFTVRTPEQNSSFRMLPVDVEGDGEETISAREEENWSGLEGVTRVNSIVQLPRFSNDRTNS